LASSLHYAAHDNAKRLRWIAFRLLIPSLIPFAGSNTDYNGHLGGAVAGGLMGFALLVCWPEDEDRPRLGRVMAATGWTGLALAVAAFALVATRHGTYIARGRNFVPDSMLPTKGWGTHAEARAMTERYPHDPRARLYAAKSYFEAGNAFAAEREARLGLAETEILQRDMPEAIGQALRYFLVSALMQERRPEEARREAAPLCDRKPPEDLRKAREAIGKLGFCPAAPAV
jgi:rhomboid protease GluP